MNATDPKLRTAQAARELVADALFKARVPEGYPVFTRRECDFLATAIDDLIEARVAEMLGGQVPLKMTDETVAERLVDKTISTKSGGWLRD